MGVGGEGCALPGLQFVWEGSLRPGSMGEQSMLVPNVNHEAVNLTHFLSLIKESKGVLCEQKEGQD